MYSWFFSTTIERVHAETVLCLGAETPAQATQFYDSEQRSELDPVQKKLSSVEYTKEFFTNIRHFSEVTFEESH